MSRLAFLLVFVVFALPSMAQTWPTRPDRTITPGAIRNLSLTKICETTWGSDARAVTTAMKQAVRDEYEFSDSMCPFTKIKGKRVRRAEIDHLVPRSLGGADEQKNLWPQCYEPVNKDQSKQLDGAYKKDRLEKKLNVLVCESGSVKLLKEYQRKIRRDWISLYHEIYGDE